MAELIAEGTSTPVLIGGGGSLAAVRAGVRDPASERAVEPSASSGGATSGDRDDSPALTALTAPLSVRNVTETQGFATRDPNAPAPLEVEDPISPDTPLNAPLDAGDVSDSRAIAREGVDAGARKKEKEAEEKTVEMASAEGSKIVEDKDKKGADGLTEDQRQEVADLKRRDAEVKAHEQAHAAAGGPYAGAPRFRFVRGPDGKFYAVAGEVTIDTAAIPNNPEATIRKMQQVKRAALAPQEPSAQDRRVAADAERKIIQARQQIREEADKEVKEAQEKQARLEAEARGDSKSISPQAAPAFDPEARYRSEIGGTGPAPGTGLAGPGEIDVDMSDAIDAKSLFSMVA